MENSKIELIFPFFSSSSSFFFSIIKKMAYKMCLKFVSQIFMKIFIHRIFSNKCPERLFKNLNF